MAEPIFVVDTATLPALDDGFVTFFIFGVPFLALSNFSNSAFVPAPDLFFLESGSFLERII